MPPLALAPVLALAAAVAGRAAAPPDGLAAADREALARGETVARLVETAGGGVREGVGMRVLPAPPERVFRAVTDYGHYREFMPFMTASDATPEAAAVVSRQTLALPGGTRNFAVRARSEVRDGADSRLWIATWALVPGSGDFRENAGSWTLAAFPGGGTLVVLRLRSDSGIAPARLEDRATLKSLPWILDGLRQQVNRCRYDDPEPPGCNGG